MTEAASPTPFVHLRVHSEFSVVDGIVQIPDLVKQVASFGQPAVALTDLSNIFGLIKFYKSARGKGVKPIAGCDIWVQNEADRDKPHRLLLLVRNNAGYLQLCEILTRSWLENQYAGRAEVKRQWLEGADGLIVLSGGRLGDIGQALEAGRDAEAQVLAQQWAARFPGAFYIELQRSGADGDEPYVQAAMRLAATTSSSGVIAALRSCGRAAGTGPAGAGSGTGSPRHRRTEAGSPRRSAASRAAWSGRTRR